MEPAQTRPGVVLVVDDQKASAELLRRWLEADGHTVVTAGSGEAALAALAAHKPDLVLLDIMIPSPTGFEICQRIKGDPATHHIPVLLMSGLQDPANWKRGLEVGADHFLAKPFQSQELRARVREYLGRARGS
jgi:two-component system cell cycle response regulator